MGNMAKEKDLCFCDVETVVKHDSGAVLGSTN